METEPIAVKKQRKTITKKPLDNARMAKYFILKQKGMNKKEAQLNAGYSSPAKNSYQIEHSKTYQAIEKRYFKDIIQDQISMPDIVAELKKNIVQDDDKGAKNKAIELAMNRVEPETKVTQEESILVVLK